MKDPGATWQVASEGVEDGGRAGVFCCTGGVCCCSWPCVAFSAAAADVGMRVGVGTGDENARRGVLACEMSSISERAWKVDDMICSLLAPRSLLAAAGMPQDFF